MGQFRVTVTAVGGHGCSREAKDGQVVAGCGKSGCPDCAARRFVAELKSQGQSVQDATLQHWPGDPSEVKDNLLTGVRTGQFGR